MNGLLLYINRVTIFFSLIAVALCVRKSLFEEGLPTQLPEQDELDRQDEQEFRTSGNSEHAPVASQAGCTRWGIGEPLEGSFSAVSKPNLQVNMFLIALAEIYTMQSFALL